jgi:hypothetical protein
VYYIYICFCLSNLRPNNSITLPPRAPYSLHLPSILPYNTDTYFWLVVVWKLIGLRPIKAMVYFFLFFLCCSFFCPNNGITFSTRLPLVSPLLHTSLCCGRLFLVGCCVTVNRGPSKGNSVFHIHIFFHCLNSHPKRWDSVTPHALPPMRLHPKISLPLPPTFG